MNKKQLTMPLYFDGFHEYNEKNNLINVVDSLFYDLLNTIIYDTRINNLPAGFRHPKHLFIDELNPFMHE